MALTFSYISPLTNDSILQSTSAAYVTARAGGTLVAAPAAAVSYVGQQFASLTYYVYVTYMEFDTGAIIPDDAVIAGAALYLWGQIDQSVTDFTVEARPYDFGATVDVGDWVPGANLAATGSLLASRATSAGWSTVGYNLLAGTAAFIPVINKTGPTRVIVYSSRELAGTVPTGAEYVGFHSQDAIGAHATKKPLLLVTWQQERSGVATVSAITATSAAARKETSAPVAISAATAAIVAARKEAAAPVALSAALGVGVDAHKAAQGAAAPLTAASALDVDGQLRTGGELLLVEHSLVTASGRKGVARASDGQTAVTSITADGDKGASQGVAFTADTATTATGDKRATADVRIDQPVVVSVAAHKSASGTAALSAIASLVAKSFKLGRFFEVVGRITGRDADANAQSTDRGSHSGTREASSDAESYEAG